MDDRAECQPVGAMAVGAYERLVADAFREFALRFRREMGHPMSDREWSLAKLAHATGFMDGADNALRLLEILEQAEMATAGHEQARDE